jgi:hypothetical protein
LRQRRKPFLFLAQIRGTLFEKNAPRASPKLLFRRLATTTCLVLEAQLPCFNTLHQPKSPLQPLTANTACPARIFRHLVKNTRNISL